jgi:shikimate kinase
VLFTTISKLLQAGIDAEERDWIMIITLVGYRGCGKSSVGPLLAERIGCSFADSDSLVEARAGKSISEVFADGGEAAFRQLETDVLEDLLDTPPAVIATGGGAVLAEINRQRMHEAGPVVWLRASAELLASRIAGDQSSGKNRRPSLTGKPVVEEVAEVLEARRFFYEQASTLVIHVETGTPEEIAERIFDAVTAMDFEETL